MTRPMLGLWANAPGAAAAVPIPRIQPTVFLHFAHASGLQRGHYPVRREVRGQRQRPRLEWILAFKIDQKLGQNDNAFFRYKGDHGIQPTTLDAISPKFDALSNQPSYDMQFGETHVLGPRSTNNFTAAFSHYVAQFAQNAQLVAQHLPLRRGHIGFWKLCPLD